MASMVIGYARCSTDAQDLTAQRDALTVLGVQPDRIDTDHGLTGTNRARPGLREALAACRAGDTLVVTKPDRLAHSLPDARDIVEELTEADVKLNIGGSIHDPADPVGRLLRQYAAVLRGELTGTRADELLTDVGSRRVASADLDAIAKDLESWAERDWVAVIDIGPEREHLAGPLPPFPGPADSPGRGYDLAHEPGTPAEHPAWPGREAIAGQGAPRGLSRGGPVDGHAQ